MRAGWVVVEGAGLIGLGILVLIATGSRDSRGDSSNKPSGSATTIARPVGSGIPARPEPVTGAAAIPAHGWETVPKDPFSPPDLGVAPNKKTPKPYWSVKDLSPADRAAATKTSDPSELAAIHNAYGVAIAEQVHRARGTSAASQLGLDDLNIGVVP